MYDDLNIDELLSGYIDGQLSPRHETEVKRLITHDKDIAERLGQMQKIKELLKSLPSAEAPPQMLDEIKARLERRTLLETEPEHFDRRKGVRQLMMRKVLSAAAMITLLAILGGVIYNITDPPDTSDISPKQIATKEPAQPKGRLKVIDQSPVIATAAVEKPITVPLEVATALNAVLELKASNQAAVNAFVKRAIIDNDLSKYLTVPYLSDGRLYTLSCRSDDLNPLLADLQQLWPKLDSAALTIETKESAAPVLVKNITAQQLSQIIDQPNLEKNVQTAKNFAALNNMTELLPGKDLLEAAGQTQPDLITIPRPVLTSGEKKFKKEIAKYTDSQNINLTIIVTDLKENN